MFLDGLPDGECDNACEGEWDNVYFGEGSGKMSHRQR